MRRLTILALAVAMAFGLATPAQSHDPEAEARYLLEHKLKQPWIAHGGFTPDFDKAQERAAKEKKPVFAYFTISFMDVPRCESLEKGVLSSPEFKAFGESVVLFVHVKSGLDGPHADLLRDKGGTEVPYFAVLDDLGNVIAQAEGNEVKAFERAVRAGKEFAELKRKPDKSADETVYVLTHEMDIGNLKFQRAKDLVAALGKLTEAQQKQVDAALFRLEVWSAVADAKSSYARSRAAGELFAGMLTDGREPSTENLIRPFFVLVMDHAERTNDAKLFEKALDKLRDRYGEREDEEWKAFFKEQADRLAAFETPVPDAGGEDAE